MVVSLSATADWNREGLLGRIGLSDAQFRAPSYSSLFLGVTLALFQVLDGVLTSMGVSKHGISAEGNPILRSLMESFGYVETLTAVKILAIGVIFFLLLLSDQISWLKKAMGSVAAVYLFAAIIPWTVILFA